MIFSCTLLLFLLSSPFLLLFSSSLFSTLHSVKSSAFECAFFAQEFKEVCLKITTLMIDEMQRIAGEMMTDGQLVKRSPNWISQGRLTNWTGTTKLI